MPRVFREEFIQEQRQVSIGVESSRVQSVKKLHGRQFAVRAYDGRSISIAGGLGFPDRDMLWKQARSGLDGGIPYPVLPHRDRRDKVVETGSLPGDTRLLEEAEIILSELRHRHSELTFSGRIVGSSYSAVMKNERGLDLFFSSPLFKCMLTFRHRDSGESFDGYAGTFGVGYSRERILSDLEVGCGTFTEPLETPSSGRMPVVISMGAEDFLYKQLLRELTGSSLNRGTSRFSGKLNQPLLNPGLSMIQTSDSHNTGLKHFDKEGTVNDGHSLVLISHGAPVRPITDRMGAMKFGCENSGSAFSGGYDSVPSVGLPFVRVKPSGGTLSEILDGREALLIVLPGGGGLSDEGRFSSTVQLAYLYRDGRIRGRVPPANVSADLDHLFGDGFLGCSSDSLLSMTHSPCLVCEMDVEFLSSR